MTRQTFFPLCLMLIGALLIAFYVVGQRPSPTPTPRPSRTPEPIIPTRAASTRTAPISEVMPFSLGTAVPSASDLAGEGLIPTINRFGVTGSLGDVRPARDAGLPFGLFASWGPLLNLPEVEGVQYWQMARAGPDGVRTDWARIEQAVQLHPGSVWIVGNEPDVRWQDNVEPAAYARQYHEVYAFIKSRDPSAQLAIAGVAISTPLRRAYLEQVLAAYEAEFGAPMPIDIWTVHAYTLREEAGSWGVDIPPGLADLGEELGRKYELADHGRIDIFAQNLIDFRAWMAEQGYQERPLAVTEFGLIMPEDYGFPPEMIGEYMEQAFDFLLTAANDTGYGADDGRLVQWWLWFSIYQPEDNYPVPNLYDRQTGELTYLGQVFADYVNAMGDGGRD
ncbi:MAG: hypothetical protein ACE5FD_01985 [Anaerolineae bacterium]